MTRHWGPVAAIVFAGVLAYVVGVRLSESAMAVVIGVTFGVAASIPTSLILILALRRADRDRPDRARDDSRPPTIVVTPPGMPTPGHGQPWGFPPGTYLPPLEGEQDPALAPRRRFRIIGGEED